MLRNTRPIQWVKAARKDFETFPHEARDNALDALTFLAAGGFPSIARPLKGLGNGVFELALRYRTEAFRVVYVLQIAADIWVVHVFQKKSKSGIKTLKAVIDLIRERIKRLKELYDEH
jgi:phage-related protein